MNRSLVLRSCREDGVLLRADKPATAIDTSWSKSFDTLKPIHAWGTFSQVGSARWSYLLGLDLVDPLRIPVSTLDPAAVEAAEAVAGTGDSGRSWVAYEGWHGIAASATVGSVCHKTNTCFQLLQASGSGAGSQELVLPRCTQVSDMMLGHTLWNVAPVLPGGWVYLGETDKIVAASGRRLYSWDSTTPTLILTLLAAVKYPSHPLIYCAHSLCAAFVATTCLMRVAMLVPFHSRMSTSAWECCNQGNAPRQLLCNVWQVQLRLCQPLQKYPTHTAMLTLL